MPVRPSAGTGQDWGSVNVGSKSTVKKSTASRSGQTELRYGAVSNSRSTTGSGMSARKLEESEETRHAKVDKSLSKAIMQARTAKGWTQKQLGTAINEKPQVVGEYEQGKAIPNNSLIAKMERALGCKLPRPKKTKKAPSSTASGSTKKATTAGVTRGGPAKRR